jgi:hypothetical protein
VNLPVPVAKTAVSPVFLAFYVVSGDGDGQMPKLFIFLYTVFALPPRTGSSDIPLILFFYEKFMAKYSLRPR